MGKFSLLDTSFAWMKFVSVNNIFKFTRVCKNSSTKCITGFGSSQDFKYFLNIQFAKQLKTALTKIFFLVFYKITFKRTNEETEGVSSLESIYPCKTFTWLFDCYCSLLLLLKNSWRTLWGVQDRILTWIIVKMWNHYSRFLVQCKSWMYVPMFPMSSVSNHCWLNLVRVDLDEIRLPAVDITAADQGTLFSNNSISNILSFHDVNVKFAQDQARYRILSFFFFFTRLPYSHSNLVIGGA